MKVRIGYAQYALVPSAAKTAVHSEADARRVVARMVQSPSDLLRLREFLEHTFELGFGASEAQVVERAVDLLQRGHMLAVRMDEAARTLGEPEIRPLIEPVHPSQRGAPIAEPRSPLVPEQPGTAKPGVDGPGGTPPVVDAPGLGEPPRSGGRAGPGGTATGELPAEPPPTARCDLYRFDRYYPGQRTFLPRTIATTRGKLDSLDLVADFLVGATKQQGTTQIVAAHADATGSGKKNQEITDARAKSMRAFLEGDRATWMRGLTDDDRAVATRILFRWISDRYGWAVDTGTEPGWSQRCREALETYRAEVAKHIGTAVGDGPSMTDADWEAAFELLHDALVASLRGDPETLAQLRGNLALSDDYTLGCADRFVSEAGPPDDPEAARRVELLLLNDPSALTGDLASAKGLFDRARVQRTLVTHEPRAELRLGVRSDDGVPLPGVPYELEVEGFKTASHSTPRGAVLSPRVPISEFTVRLHDPNVLLAHDLAHRIRAAIDSEQPAAIVPPLSHASGVADLLATTYAKLYSTNLADDVREASTGTAVEMLLRALLASCGLSSDAFVFHSFKATREPS